MSYASRTVVPAAPARPHLQRGRDVGVGEPAGRARQASGRRRRRARPARRGASRTVVVGAGGRGPSALERGRRGGELGGRGRGDGRRRPDGRTASARWRRRGRPPACPGRAPASSSSRSRAARSAAGQRRRRGAERRAGRREHRGAVGTAAARRRRLPPAAPRCAAATAALAPAAATSTFSRTTGRDSPRPGRGHRPGSHRQPIAADPPRPATSCRGTADQPLSRPPTCVRDT